jgi:hypothetical protein
MNEMVNPNETNLPAKEKESSVSELQAMIQLLLKREARAVAKEEEEQTRLENRQKQRDRNAESSFIDKFTAQSKCKHLKGGKNRKKTQVLDYAVYHHTFINMERCIRCFICGMKWKAKDTKEFLVRHGKKIANHTGIGWQEALAMLEQSSNTPSRSEGAVEVVATAQTETD